ncbi:TPA: PmbA/TldA family metallopeptidase, partial [Neisseria meningitidis]
MLFNHTASELLDLCRRTLDLAKATGATAAEADFSESLGQSVSVRLGEIEQIEFQQDKSLDITVYVGKRKGRASTADFSEKALQDTVKAAIDIARHTAEDGCAGLADACLMAKHIGDPDLYHEWDLDTEAAVGLAKQCEQAALNEDERIENSEGAAVQTGHYQYVYGNTHGFAAH